LLAVYRLFSLHRLVVRLFSMSTKIEDSVLLAPPPPLPLFLEHYNTFQSITCLLSHLLVPSFAYGAGPSPTWPAKRLGTVTLKRITVPYYRRRCRIWTHSQGLYRRWVFSEARTFAKRSVHRLEYKIRCIPMSLSLLCY
jgi:hypothetical protein